MSLPAEYRALAVRQDGVVSRAQLVAAGVGDHAVRRWVRRRLVTSVHRGVFVDHTGVLTWRQRAWAAVLLTAPSALDGWSALRAAGVCAAGDTDAVVHVVVQEHRRLVPPPGIVVRRVRDLEPRVRWAASPPRLRTEEAVVLVAARAADDRTTVGIVTDAVQARHTTAARLRAVVDSRARLPRRALLLDVLDGLEHGAESVLEHAYLRRVEGAHGLPRGVRQGSVVGADRHDVVHEAERVVIELDGRAHHSLANDRFHDLQRDISSAVAGHVTVRLGWGQVLGAPCETARRVGELLRVRGWRGEIRPCARCR